MTGHCVLSLLLEASVSRGMPLSGLIRLILASENELGHVSLFYFRPGGYLVECSGCAHKGGFALGNTFSDHPGLRLTYICPGFLFSSVSGFCCSGLIVRDGTFVSSSPGRSHCPLCFRNVLERS